MADAPVSLKLYIPHPFEADCTLVGVLERISPSNPTQGRNIALILHGSMGHKDYLYQKRLARRLPTDSFRFDFRGCFESGGTWREGALKEDLVDLQVVVEYLKSNYGWICTSEEGKNISGFVNVSGYHRTDVQYPLTSDERKSWQEKGYMDWTVSVAGKPVTVRICSEDAQDFANWDTSLIWDHFPLAVDVLTLHGFADTIAPPYDAVLNAQALENRSPGTHVLNFLDGADHAFTGRLDEVVDRILVWWAKRQAAQLKTGIWSDRFDARKGKL